MQLGAPEVGRRVAQSQRGDRDRWAALLPCSNSATWQTRPWWDGALKEQQSRKLEPAVQATTRAGAAAVSTDEVDEVAAKIRQTPCRFAQPFLLGESAGRAL